MEKHSPYDESIKKLTLMRHSILLLFLLHVIMPLPAQRIDQVAPAATGNVYAIVVGISAYENPGIPALSFAHKDAEVFTEYLTSKAGGSVPTENIRTLLNEKATYAAIYDALAWLLETCKENDLVYFYFSGHGDMENNTIYKLGFLLSYNSPRTNYLNSAVRIEDLNNFANTLSVKAKARVVLITDACHSGDLAGKNFRGSSLVGQQLKAVKNQEIRITSCAPDQLSVEDEGWGGGRGVFSFYLINGLLGQADQVQDGAITLQEIKRYLDSMMARDALLAQKAHLQNPSVTGNQNFTIALVDKTIRHAAKESPSPPIVFLKPIAKSTQSYFFDALAMQNVEDVYDFNLLDTYPTENLPFAFLTLASDDLKRNVSDSQLHEISENLKANPDALKRFTNKLVVLLSDRGQEVINDYLEGDEAELERRRYYNSNISNYDEYPKMFSLALKMAQPGSYLADILKVKYHYFNGIAARLKIPLVKDPSSLIAEALRSQQQALSLEQNAAYIHNELGVLFSAKDELQKAEMHFTRATQIAPAWSIPWTNLSGIYLDRKQLVKARDAVQRSLSLQPENQGAFLSLGLIYEQEKNLLYAEEFFRTGIELNSRHYLPFERLAYTYLKTTDYALADSFFYEADLRKKGFHFSKPSLMRIPKALSDLTQVNQPCDFDTFNIRQDDVLGNFAWAMLHLQQGNKAEAEKKLRQVIHADSSNPLAWHYLGKIKYQAEQWMQADVMFRHALDSYLDSAAFDAYLLRKAASRDTGFSDKCILAMFRQNAYRNIEDHYLLASLSEKWAHFYAAEMQYRIIIQKDSTNVGAYQKLWTLFELMGRYADAEQIVKDLRAVDKQKGNQALFSFYRRMIARFPGDKIIHYTAGNFLYNLVSVSPTAFVRDQKVAVPDSKEEALLIGFTHPGFAQQIRLPGTGEEIVLAPIIPQPFTDGIRFFQIADSLYEEDETRAEINQKIGDLFNWQGLTKRSMAYYKHSVDLQPGNADNRMKLIRSSALNYKFKEALAQLDSLKQRKQLNLEMQRQMAKYKMHAANFEEAAALLIDIEAVYPYELPENIELRARLNFLKNNPREALLVYKQLLALQPDDPHVMYSLARVQAQMNNRSAALQALKRSIDNGFNYSWVVKEDDSWKSYRNKSEWKKLVNKMQPKAYLPNSIL